MTDLTATARLLSSGRATGALIGDVVHVLKRSSSRYGLMLHGVRRQYCCQDGCCDSGLQSDVADVVRQAKELGATKVVIRTGQRSYYVGEIAGLPVKDVSDYVGRVGEDIFVVAGPRW